MEDARAWRKYVASLRRAAERQYFQSYSVADGSADTNATDNRLIESIEGHSENRQTSDSVPTSAPAPPTPVRAGNVLTVYDASRSVGVSVCTMYSWLQERKLAIEPEQSRYLIRVSELERLASVPRLTDVISTVTTRRDCSLASAQRHVSRLRNRGFSLQEISRQAVASKTVRAQRPHKD